MIQKSEAIAVFQWPNFKIGEGLKNDVSRVLNYGGKYSCKLFTHFHIFKESMTDSVTISVDYSCYLQ